MTPHPELLVHGVPKWTLADRLRKAREVAGLSQGELAEAIDVSRRSVVNYEAGARPPKRHVLVSWALRTGARYDWLITGAASDEDGPNGGDDLRNAQSTGITGRRGRRRVTRRYLGGRVAA